MPHQIPEDIKPMYSAVHFVLKATDLTDTSWEQRDVEQALEVMAKLAGQLQILTARAKERSPSDVPGYGSWSSTLDDAAEHLGLAMLDLSHAAEMMHMQWMDSMYAAVEAAEPDQDSAPVAYEPNLED